jgi:ABC-type transporter Mla subunit MlaD
MRRLASTALVLAAGAAALLFAGASDSDSALKTYEIEFDNAFGLVEGGDLKIGGVTAGQTTGFRLTETRPYRTIVTVEVDTPGFDSLREDAECDVRQQSLIGEYFVDCDLGSADAKALPDGGRIPVERTTSTIPPDLISNIQRRPYRERFRLIISELGTGLAGRPEDLNEVIRRAHPGLRETAETINILARQNRIIRDFITNADRVSEAVEPNKENVARWAEEAADTAGIQASRSEELARYWNRLPTFLGELEPTMAQLERTADRQIPTLRRLREAAPELTAFLTEIEPFARSSRGSFASLGEAAETGREALRESKEEIAELRDLSVNAPKLGKPLRQFLQTIDDRVRSTTPDPSAEAVAPPAPDKTAWQGNPNHGFTGMEAFWNYIYFQTLGINALDDLGHLLRITAFAAGPCAPYAARPTQAVINECNSWLGPFQPGVTAPDPTASPGGATAALRRADRPQTPTERQAPRQPGDVPAQPDPGKPDPSKPQIVLPDQLQELLDRLNGTLPPLDPPKLDLGPDTTMREAEQLLDFLLAP